MQEEERWRAQAEAIRRQKLLASLEVKWKARGVALLPQGAPKVIRASEKGKEVELGVKDFGDLVFRFAVNVDWRQRRLDAVWNGIWS